MQIVLFTKGLDLTVKSVYFPEYKKYATIYEYPNGYQMVVEVYTSIMHIMETHNFWCKYSGIIEGTYSSAEVEMHLSRAFSDDYKQIKIA